jgi:hypothetical protein
VKALLDTGDSHCFIDSKLASLLHAEIKSENLPSITIGNSTQISPTGSCNLSFRIGNKRFSHEFFVLSNLPFQCILGIDFIVQSKLVLDLANGNFFFESKCQNKLEFANAEFLCALQGLSSDQDKQLSEMLSSFPDVMTDQIGCANSVYCDLKLKSDDPIAQQPYRVSPAKKELIRSTIRKMLDLGIIRPSESEWASPVNMLSEQKGFRFTIDYRKLNSQCRSDPYCIPRMDSLLNRLGEASFISKIDLRKGYWQIRMADDSIPKTAFICDEGKFEFVRMPFGLKTAPSIFQREMNKILKNARGLFADAYLDDIIIYSRTWKEHLEHIKFVLERLREAGLTANVEKCDFGKTTIKYLGFLITPEGVSTDPDKTDAVSQYPVPRSAKQVKQFLGLCGWYRHFIPNFSSIAEPLNRLLKKSVLFSWEESEQHAFSQLKSLICNAVTLAYPDFTKPFILRTDSSDVGLGAVLAQKAIDGFERPIAFASRSLSITERNYHAAEKECLAIVWALKKFEHYLDGVVFDLETDNRALVWLHKMKDVNSKFVRWALRIQDFQACIKHCPGRLNVVADALSRNVVGGPEEEENKRVMDPLACSLALLNSFSTEISLDSIRSSQNLDTETQALLICLPPS